ncbi:MAG: lamin tail domain-containing protein [Spirulinaceae cyanobacterium]
MALTSSVLRGGIVLNEVLIDPNGSNNFDTDNSGVAATTDEFVELYNSSDTAISLAGLQLWDAGNDNWFTFPAGTVLEPGKYAVVIVGVQAGGSLPDVGEGNLAFDAGRGGGVINNGGDNVVLYDPTMDEYVQLAYNGDSFDDPTTYDNFSPTATLAGTAEDWGNDTDGVSLVRQPAGDTNVVQHNAIADTNASPGTATGDVPEPPTPTTTPIYEIQGEGHISPFAGQSVVTTGIVTAVDFNGFYLQDATGDGNELTSDGILVFTRSTPTVSVGDEVEVSGTVTEFIPGGASTGNLSTTEIVNPTIATISTGNALPVATILGESGRKPPTQVIDNDNFSVFDPSEDGIDFYESVEGMRVTVEDAVAVSPSNRFGEVFTLANQGNNATGVSDRGTINISPDDFNPERIQIQYDRDLVPDFSPEVNTGDTLGDVTGVVDYSFGNFEVKVTEAFTVTDGGLQPEVSVLTAGDDQLTVASYNVQNLDPRIENPDLTNRGFSDVDDDLGEGKFAAIAAQIVNNLHSPDIVGVQEIQDNDGGEISDVVDASLTYQTLIEAIVAAGGPRYEFIDLPPENRQDGGQPGGNIRVGYLYDASRVDYIPDSAERIGEGTMAFTDTRKSVAAKFLFNGEEVTLVNNHFSSKGGSSPLFGQTQPAVDLQTNPTVNGGVDERTQQAQVVQDYIENILTTDADANVIALGDFNEFEFLPPLEILEQSLTNLTETLPPNERYSYIFQGNSQSLDHILTSDNLVPVAEFDAVQTNSEFSNQASDHDPLLSRFTLTVPENVLWGSLGDDNLVGDDENQTLYGRFGDDVVAGGLGDDTIFGGDGDDVLRGDRNLRKSQVNTPGGDDIIYGGDGDDRIGGKSGNDILYGDAGDDRIWGDDGDDILRGGLGNDILTGDDFSGGQGRDTFVLASGEGTDTIVDFELGIDFIGLAENLSFGQLTIFQQGNHAQIAFEDEMLAVVRNTNADALIAMQDTAFVTV